ncbi:MAG: segregation ATPase FtsK/SpoIIIE, family, partial [Pseudonocardiales bacterium]|nr:segregation ATPase FtsK/SpoIIIE, family [Pseudonocardiales bacterium]
MRIDLTVATAEGDVDVAVAASGGTTLRQVRRALEHVAGLPPGSDLGRDGDCVLGRDIRNGARLAPRAGAGVGPTPLLRVLVVGGTDSGAAAELPAGGLVVGRSPHCALPVTDEKVSRRHLQIDAHDSGVYIRDLGTTNGTTVEGDPLGSSARRWLPGEYVRLGDSVLALAASEVDTAANISDAPNGRLVVSRAPRRSPVDLVRVIEFPTQLSTSATRHAQWFAVGVSLVAAVAIAGVLHSAQYLAFMLIAPLVALATAVGDWVQRRRQRRRGDKAHGLRLAAAQDAVRRTLRAEASALRDSAPDAATLAMRVRARDARIWERSATDPDALVVRLGLADLASGSHVREDGRERVAGTIGLAPVSVDLRVGPIGITGPTALARRLARWVVAQLAILHSPDDVELVLLLSEEAEADWRWTRWLPHVHRRPALDPLEQAAVLAALRQRCNPPLAASVARPGPWLVVVCDGAGSVLAGLAEGFGPGAPLTAVCIERTVNRLPAACRTLVHPADDGPSRIEVRSACDLVESALTDALSESLADEIARNLAPLVAAGSTASAVPARCRLTDVLGIGPISPAAVLARWRRADNGAAAAVGVGVGGPAVLDLPRDGPHALIAGTTGSGKSELVKAWVLALAAGYPPSSVSFVLVDYKGGAAFAECAGLPHVAGVVTDLDASLTRRALASLHAELTRRERLLATVGAADLPSYRLIAGIEPLARLVIVVDEFATLVDELPGFVDELVGVARRGRSLGLHLVLATQRPAGVLSPEIRANTSLRIALRTSEAADSLDVIGSPEAAEIPPANPGRAVVRTAERRQTVQVAQVGLPISHADPSVPTVELLDRWRSVPGAVPSAAGGTGRDGTDPPELTELAALRDAIRVAAAESGVPPARAPWQQPLPALVLADELPATADRAVVSIGVEDLPARQEQRPVLLDLARGGTVLLAGTAGSGRTTALTAATVLAAGSLDPGDLAVYVIDWAGGGLSELGALPHCATTVTPDGADLLATLIERLRADVDRRRSVLSGCRAPSVREARDAGRAFPLALVVIDGWDALVAASEHGDAGRSARNLLELMRSASAVGVTVLAAGTATTLATRLAGTAAEVFVLRLSDQAEYARAGVATAAMPADAPPGRAIRAASGTEVQFACLDDRPAPEAVRARVAALRSAHRPSPAHRPAPLLAPIALRPLPARVDAASLPTREGLAVLGVGGDGAGPLAVDLFAGARRMLVAGPPRSGRTTVLRLLVEHYQRAGVRAVIAAPARSPLAQLARSLELPLSEPNSELPSGPIELLVIDDGEAFTDTTAGALITDLLRSAPA